MKNITLFIGCEGYSAKNQFGVGLAIEKGDAQVQTIKPPKPSNVSQILDIPLDGKKFSPMVLEVIKGGKKIVIQACKIRQNGDQITLKMLVDGVEYSAVFSAKPVNDSIQISLKCTKEGIPVSLVPSGKEPVTLIRVEKKPAAVRLATTKHSNPKNEIDEIVATFNSEQKSRYYIALGRQKPDDLLLFTKTFAEREKPSKADERTGDDWSAFRTDMVKLRVRVAEFMECADGHRGRTCGDEEEDIAVVLKDAAKQVTGKGNVTFSDYRLKNGDPFTRIEDVCPDPVIEMQNGGNDPGVFYPARLAAYEVCLKGINTLIFAPSNKK